MYSMWMSRLIVLDVEGQGKCVFGSWKGYILQRVKIWLLLRVAVEISNNNVFDSPFIVIWLVTAGRNVHISLRSPERKRLDQKQITKTMCLIETKIKLKKRTAPYVQLNLLFCLLVFFLQPSPDKKLLENKQSSKKLFVETNSARRWGDNWIWEHTVTV